MGLRATTNLFPYDLFPESIYTVSVSAASFRTKVSVGSNPWVKEPLKYNLARFASGVRRADTLKAGAISFPVGSIDEARKAAAEIA